MQNMAFRIPKGRLLYRFLPPKTAVFTVFFTLNKAFQGCFQPSVIAHQAAF
jgi:hypothetical protein